MLHLKLVLRSKTLQREKEMQMVKSIDGSKLPPTTYADPRLRTRGSGRAKGAGERGVDP